MSGNKEDIPAMVPIENKQLMTISRNLFLGMRQQCFNSNSLQEELHRKEQEMRSLQLKCQSAERNVILLEIKFCQLLLQISQDSSNLRTSIFMSYQGIDSDGESHSEYSSPSASNSALLHVDLLPMSPTNDTWEESSDTSRTSTVLFNKLALELLKTKKHLLSILQERDDVKFNIPAMELEEYKEIVRVLQQKLLTVQLQYAEMRLAVQSSAPNDSLSIIGALQDQIRKQHTYSEPKTDESDQSKGDNFDKDSQSKAATVPTVNSRETTTSALNYRQEFNELKEKCQRLTELVPTWETLQRMTSSLMSGTLGDQQNEFKELGLVKDQLEVSRIDLESLKKENSDLKKLEGKLKEQSEEMFLIQAENRGLKKQIKLLSDKLTESNSKLQISENQNLVLREIERRGHLPSSCGREIIRVAQDLSQTDLMVDGTESLLQGTTLPGMDQVTNQEPSENKEPQNKISEAAGADSLGNVNTDEFNNSLSSKGMDVRAEYKTRKLLEMTVNDNVDDKKGKSPDGKLSVRNKAAMETTESDTVGASADTNTTNISGERTSPQDGDHNKQKH